MRKVFESPEIDYSVQVITCPVTNDSIIFYVSNEDKVGYKRDWFCSDLTNESSDADIYHEILSHEEHKREYAIWRRNNGRSRN